VSEQVDVAAVIYDRIVDLPDVDGLDNEQIHGVAWEAAGALQAAGYRVVKQEPFNYGAWLADCEICRADLRLCSRHMLAWRDLP
jgi:hypothetical protein